MSLAFFMFGSNNDGEDNAPNEMQDNVIIKKFPSGTQFLEWATNAPCQWKRELASRETDDPEWRGTKNYQEAYNLALYGWPEGLKLLSDKMKLAEQIIPPTVKPTCNYDIAGYYPNPSRAAAGDPFNMVMPQREEMKQKPIVKIRTNFSYLASVDAEEIMNWGASVCSYINALESKGYQIQLDAINESQPSCGRNGPSTSFQFPLKSAGEALSLSNVVFWWAHPAAQRRIAFSARERLDIEEWHGDGYGRTHNVTMPEEGTLALSIDDSGTDLEENMALICEKHKALLDPSDPLHKTISHLSASLNGPQ